MSPTALIHLSPDALRHCAREGLHACPTARPAERKWAGVAFVVFISLAVLLISVVRV